MLHVNDFLERQTQDALDQSHSKLIVAAPLAAQRSINVFMMRTIEDMLLFKPLRAFFELLIVLLLTEKALSK